ncbi:MAG: DNA repair exonuclease-like protein [Burkholderiaceae bacterium]|nr:MAG: DNA repair exonuclease-like protein [Burkholderiaceae bacterium]
MKIAQMSDLHYCAKNLAEADRCFGFAVTQAIEAGVDGAIITGDSTDHAMDAHAPAVIALARQLKRLANHCPVLMLQGTFSHEPPGLLRMFELIGANHPITIADRAATFGLSHSQFEMVESSKDYRLVVNALPTLNKADIAALTPNAVGDASHQAGDLISQILESFAAGNRSLRMRDVPTMVISHGTVLNCMTEHGVPMAGADHEYGLGSLFAADADVVALGHIHKHQVWENERTVSPGGCQIAAYAGSIGCFHYGEEGQKVWVEWNMVAGNPSFEARPTPSRQTVDLFFDGPPDLDKIREMAPSLKGLFVRLRYEVDEEHRQRVDRDAINALLADAAEVQIEGKTLIVERVRAAGISTVTSLSEKLKKWCDATATPFDGLEARLSQLQSQSSDVTIAAIMDRLNGVAVALDMAAADGPGEALAPSPTLSSLPVDESQADGSVEAALPHGVTSHHEEQQESLFME